MFMPDIEQKYFTFESSILTNCSKPDNADLQARLEDMSEVTLPTSGASPRALHVQPDSVSSPYVQ